MSVRRIARSAQSLGNALLLAVATVLLLLTSVATAQTTLGYRQSNLACHIQCDPPHKPDVLLNPWGVAFLPGQNFLVAEHDAGRVDSYDATGLLASGFSIPLPAGSTATASRPTGIVADPQARFSIGPSRFQFFVATEEGTIVGFNIVNGQFQDARVLVDRSTGAVFTGLTLLQPNCCAPVLAAANFHDGNIELFGLSQIAYPGAFQDPNLPDGYSPYNIQTIGDQVFVTYAKKDVSGAPLTGDGLGIISVFDQEGNFVRRFASEGGSLNAPWGLTLTSANFGPFPGKLLVGNTGAEGKILIFDPATASSLGTLTDSEGFAIANSGMHALVFRGDHVSDGIGDPDNLYYTAASTTVSQNDGLFGTVQVGRLTTTQLTVTGLQVGAVTTFTAEVHPVAGGDTATGTVDFFENGQPISSVALSGGIATLQRTFSTTGTHTIVAEYQGTDNLLESFDLKQFVIGPATTTTLTGPATAVLGRPVTITARTVSDTGEEVTGGITFKQGDQIIVVVPLIGGASSSDFTFSQPGTYSLVASYSGSNFQSSTSAPLQITVGPGDFQFTSAVPSVTVNAGQSADVNLTVSPTDGFTGAVTFSCVAPSGIACSFNPASVNVNGSAATAKVTVSAASITAQNSRGLEMVFTTFGAFGTLLIGRRRTTRKGVIALLALLVLAVSLIACGGYGAQNSTAKPRTPQTFSVTLTAASGSTSHSTPISVVVQ